MQPEPVADERGFFARMFSRDEFEAQGLVSTFHQHSMAFNPASATLRGMHYQQSPHGETKLVRCVRGKIFDVLIDIRPESPTFMQWHAVILDNLNLDTVYIPAGCAHGYLSLETNCLVEYMMDAPYIPQAARGIRFDDKAFGIAWPALPSLISERDSTYADFNPEYIS